MNISIKYILVLLIITLSSLQFYSCNSSGSSKEKNINKQKANNSNSYFPVEDKMSWEYINEAPRDESEIFKVNITSVSNDGESVFAEFDAFPFFTKTNEKTFVSINKSGEVFVRDGKGSENMFLPAASKLTKGYSWAFGDWSGYITDSPETVNTEKGTFENCIHAGFSRGGITFSTQLWLAKDVGIVKWASYRTNPPARVITYYVLK